jgi:hypothetical protein
MPFIDDHVHVPGSATVGQVLRTFVEREGQWWWPLIAESKGEFSACYFGSLLPLLTGQSPQILHNIGECAICSGSDPLYWEETGALVHDALADEASCARQVSELPLPRLPIVKAEEIRGPQAKPWPPGANGRAWGLMESGILRGVTVVQTEPIWGFCPTFDRRATEPHPPGRWVPEWGEGQHALR